MKIYPIEDSKSKAKRGVIKRWERGCLMGKDRLSKEELETVERRK
jgi:hypothetical protein